MNDKLKGVLIMGFGGPDSPEAIEPFMAKLLGRTPPPPLIQKVKARYDLIGGKSPLVDITKAQAKALEDKLNSAGGNYKVYVGMSNWKPFISEALEQMVEDGVEEACALSISPHYSRITTGAYEEELAKSFAQLGNSGADRKFEEVALVGDWYDHPLFIEAMAINAQETLNQFPRKDQVAVIFSAHSLPVNYVQGDDADPYAEQLKATVEALAQRLGNVSWHQAYQSKGGGQGEWLGPMVEEVMDKLAAQGTKDVMVVPVGFASDHIETLFDIDIDQRKHAEELGLNFRRSASLNTSPKFIEALADIVGRTIKKG